MASCTSAPRQASYSDACLSLRGESSFDTFTWACAATTRRHAPSWATHSVRASTGPLRSLMLARSCAPAKGASSTSARPTSLRTPSRQSLSRGPSPCWTSSVPCGKSPGATLLTVQNRAQVHRKPTGDLVPFSPRRVLPRFVNPRIKSKLLGFSI
jgi:hypothetical protein